MKKVLLGSSALIGAALIAQPAAAQLELKISGSVGFQAGYWEQDGDDFGDFQSEADFTLRASGVADNGLEYSATIDLLASTSDTGSNIDETYITLRGSWGSLVFGDEDGAADEMDVYFPTVGIGQLDGAHTDFWQGEPGFFFSPEYSGDSTKITYYTPRFSGFQFGVSYTPYIGSPEGTGENVAPDGDLRTGIEAGINYDANFGSTHVLASVVYARADDETGGDDPNGWAAGLQLGFGPITVGGNYVWRETVGGAEQDGFTVGASYAVGPWGFAAQYLYNDFDGFDGWEVGAGATYTLAPGLTLGLDAAYYDTDDFGGPEDGFVVLSEVKAAF